MTKGRAQFWATAGAERVFKLPEQVLPRGDLELISLTGQKQSVDESAALPYEISREAALGELPKLIRESIEGGRFGKGSSPKSGMTPEEARAILAKMREAAASPEMFQALRKLAVGLKTTAEGLGAYREKLARESEAGKANDHSEDAGRSAPAPGDDADGDTDR